MNKKQLIVILLILFSSVALFIASQVWAGSNTYCIKCKSASGRTVFNAKIWDISSDIETAEFSIDGKKVTWDKDDKAYLVLAPEDGVFTIYLDGKTNPSFPHHKYVEFWAIPSSFKIIANTSASQKYQFKAKIHGTEPRKDKELSSPTVELFCTSDYEI